MSRKKQGFTTIFNISLLVVCAVHIFSIWRNILNPELPDIKIYQKLLKDIEFPLSFRICLFEIENAYEKYLNLGYDDDWALFTGRR